MNSTPDYIEWLAKNGNDPVMRKACSMLLDGSKQQAATQQNISIGSNEGNPPADDSDLLY